MNLFARDYRPFLLFLKIIYIVALSVVGMIVFMKILGVGKVEVELRAFPFPYRAGLALCNDIEGADTVEEFLAIQRYLCTEEPTPWGMGLGLEIGNSFRFYDYSETSCLCLLDSSGKRNRSTSEVIASFIHSGHIDVLQTYGDFTEIGFDPDMAVAALNFSADRGLTIPIWVNSQFVDDPQNLGKGNGSLGDDPTSPFYHSYLLKRFGVRYIDTFGFTRIVGQGVSPGIGGWFKMLGEALVNLWNSMGKGGWEIRFTNRLLTPMKLDDGSEFLRFTRYLGLPGDIPLAAVDVNHLMTQLSRENLDRLIDKGGYMVVYTHLGANQQYSEWIPRKARRALRAAANRFRAGQLLITTTSRLLDYNLTQSGLDWDWLEADGEYIITIHGLDHPHDPDFNVDLEMLQGITFYTPDPERTSVYFGEEMIESLQLNPPDHTGRESVTIPWTPLTFPVIVLSQDDDA